VYLKRKLPLTVQLLRLFHSEKIHFRLLTVSVWSAASPTEPHYVGFRFHSRYLSHDVMREFVNFTLCASWQLDVGLMTQTMSLKRPLCLSGPVDMLGKLKEAASRLTGARTVHLLAMYGDHNMSSAGQQPNCRCG
jgi:hypothetical protein